MARTQNGGMGMWGMMPRPGEYSRSSETLGGLISQFLLILAQTVGLGLLWGLAIAIVLLSLWSLPPELWWGALTVIYAVSIVGMGILLYTGFTVPRVKWEGLHEYLDDWGRLGYAGGLALVIALAAWVFDQWIWDPLDGWTQNFFYVKVPILNGLALAAAAFTIAALLLLAARKLWTGGTLAIWIATILMALGLWYLALGTVEWERPTLHFYLFALPLAAATVYALIQGATRMRHEILHPLWGSLPWPTEEPDEEPLPEKQYITMHGAEKRGFANPGPIIDVEGPGGEEWAIAENSLIQFIKLLPTRGKKGGDWLKSRSWRGVRLDAGLVLVDKETGRKIRVDAPLTQWDKWAPFYHFLAKWGIHREGKIDPMFLDAEGKPDVEAIMEHLKLNG